MTIFIIFVGLDTRIHIYENAYKTFSIDLMEKTVEYGNKFIQMNEKGY